MTQEITICPWAGAGADPLYVDYHDTEWGRPEWDDRALYEKLVLDGFQAGLSWITILKKRDNFRTAFDGFNPEKIALYSEKDITRLLGNAGIIRHRGKIEAAIKGAQIWLDMIGKGESFSEFCWHHVDGQPIQNSWAQMKHVPAETDMSRQFSKNLKAKGFSFCGPVIVYAFAQAVGMVNDHLLSCPAYTECKS